ncbi:MAG: hypothetical protein HYS65_01825 [Betaproteobacteria bacterium]|nr:hypothetical protein [Betaproteobacteria bacterium]
MPSKAESTAAIAYFLTVLLGWFGGVPDAFAQPYPSKLIRIVVPAGPGGTLDIMARVIGQKLSDNVKQPVVVDNRADYRDDVFGQGAAGRTHDHAWLQYYSCH